MKTDLFQKVYIQTSVYEVKKPSAFWNWDPHLNLKIFDTKLFRKLQFINSRGRHTTKLTCLWKLLFFHENY